MAATAGFDVGPSADRNRRRKLSVLVAGRSVDWLLRRSEVEAFRRQQRGHSDPRRCPRRARRRVAGRRHDSVRAERKRSAVSSAGDAPAASQPPPHNSRADRTIIERRSSFRTGHTSSTTPEGTPQVRGVHVARLDGTETKRLLDADGAAVYARSGHLLFPRQGELLAQSFDATRLALAGDAFRVADSVSVNPGISLASLSASASGPIAYGTDSIRRTQFAWFDRSGKRLETLGTPDQRSLANPSLSPDASRIAFSRVVGGNWDVWLIDMQGAVSKVTSALSLDFNPVWSPDGRQIFYQSNTSTINSRSVTEGTPEQVLLREPTMIYPSDRVAGRKRSSLHSGHGPVGRPLVRVARCRPHASPIRADGVPRTRRPVFARRQVGRVSIE